MFSLFTLFFFLYIFAICISFHAFCLKSLTKLFGEQKHKEMGDMTALFKFLRRYHVEEREDLFSFIPENNEDVK